MSSVTITSPASQPRYQLLDGLRGVAAFVVIFYHFGEGFATSAVDQFMNHGYLAVDFFFVLSGFVLGYAYDGRWAKGKMTAGNFMLRRVIRLQPMVVLGALLGLAAYIVQGCVHWDGTPVPPSDIVVAFLLALLVLPVFPGMGADVRGNNEMFPLNGPEWSLFFEYIGSLLYAFFLHKLSDRALKAVVAISATGLACCVLANLSGGYNTGFGWSIDTNGLSGLGFLGGFMRMSFSFSIGLLMTRGYKAHHIPGAFWICSAMIVAVCACPYITVDGEISVLNACYDIVATLFILPAIVYIGASGHTTDAFSTGICEGLGRLSYPLYIVQYPLMYLLYHWVWSNNVSVVDAMPVCAVVLVAAPLIAFTAARFYDEPLRTRLTRRFISRG